MSNLLLSVNFIKEIQLKHYFHDSSRMWLENFIWKVVSSDILFCNKEIQLVFKWT